MRDDVAHREHASTGIGRQSIASDDSGYSTHGTHLEGRRFDVAQRGAAAKRKYMRPVSVSSIVLAEMEADAALLERLIGSERKARCHLSKRDAAGCAKPCATIAARH